MAPCAGEAEDEQVFSDKNQLSIQPVTHMF